MKKTLMLASAVLLGNALLFSSCKPAQKPTTPSKPAAEKAQKIDDAKTDLSDPQTQPLDEAVSLTEADENVSQPIADEPLSDLPEEITLEPQSDMPEEVATENEEQLTLDFPGSDMKLPALPAVALPPETILATVNDQSITQADLDQENQKVKAMLGQRDVPPEQLNLMLNALKPQILEGLVVQALIEQECTARNIVVDEEAVQKEMENIKSFIPGGESLETFLKAQGISRDMLEEQIADQLRMEKLFAIQVSDADIKDFYEANKDTFETCHARHILIKVDPADDVAQKALKKEKIQRIRQQLLDGADFAELARESSDCPSKAQGGELNPPFRRGQMVKAFETVAFSQKPNQISDVVETDFGYHIIQTLEVINPTFEELKPRIAAILKSRQMQETVEPRLEDLKSKAKISYHESVQRAPANSLD